MRTTGQLLSYDGFQQELRAYRFPESREKFDVFVYGERPQAASTQGRGKLGDIRHYTYLRIDGVSMYAKASIQPDSRVTVASLR